MTSTEIPAAPSGSKIAGGDARTVAHAEHGDLRDVGFLRDAAHSLSIFHRYLGDDHRTRRDREARSDVDRDAVQLPDLNGARMHHAGAGRGQLEHLVVADVRELARRRTTRGSAV